MRTNASKGCYPKPQNLQPTVGDVLLNSFLPNRSARLDFPTPELPSSTILTLRVCTGLLKVSMWSWALSCARWSVSSIKGSCKSKKRCESTDDLDLIR